MTKLILTVSFLLTAKALAFPEMVRHGYVHCNACHTTVVGGHLLNDYGRSLSRELLSEKSLFGKTSTEGDEAVAFGLAPEVPWLKWGGDVRLLQSFVESRQASKGRFIIMQMDFDFLASVTDQLKSFFSIGRLEPKASEATARDFVYIPRFGLEWNFANGGSETEQMGARVGRFMPAYGIAFAEHTFVTRSFLNFGTGQERLAADFHWLNDTYSVIATAIWGQAKGLQNEFEQGGIIQVASAIGQKSKVGGNFYQSTRKQNDQSYTQTVSGLFAHWGISEQAYALIELDQMKTANQTTGMLDALKLGYEARQGLHVFLTQEFANLDVSKGDPKFEAFGLGTQWFPRPHWDLYAVYRRERNTAVDLDGQDVIWLVGHFYL